MGRIGDALEARGIAADYVRVFAGEAVPESLGDAAGLVVMGGPMGVYEQDRLPFLRDELRLIESAVNAGRPVLGVCLGSQLVAAALGAAVRKSGGKEIGWFPVTLTDEGQQDPLFAGIASPFRAFHWHGDIFDIPAGAVRLASSDKTVNQAFRFFSNVYGLLFHLEATSRIVADMVTGFSAELEEERLEGSAIVSSADHYLPQLQGIGDIVFARWARLVARSSASA